jgi:hypothetical protein
MICRRFNTLKAGALTAENFYQVIDLIDEVTRLLPQRYPENPVVKCFLDTSIMAERSGKSGLPVPLLLRAMRQ